MKNIYTFKSLENYSECVHLVTKKDPSYAYEFSLALHTNENPKEIINNRDSICQHFPDMKFVVANQIHSDRIAVIKDAKEQGWRELSTAIKGCDALISNQKNIMLTILTADCVPILLFDPIQKVVAVEAWVF